MLTTKIEVSWYWDWVPADQAAEAERSAFTSHVAGLVGTWAGAKLAAAGEDAAIGEEVARELLLRAGLLAGHARLLWGAVFVNGALNAMPVLVVAEFFEPRADDPGYLMAEVGVNGLEGDVREPVVEYVSTSRGDGVRVVALSQFEGEDAVHGRASAAMRLQLPSTVEAPAAGVDVVLTTRVAGLEQVGVIGDGMELLMNMVADDSATGLRFASGGTQL